MGGRILHLSRSPWSYQSLGLQCVFGCFFLRNRVTSPELRPLPSVMKVMKSQDHIQELVQHAQQGDVGAFSKLTNHYRERLEGLVRVRLGERLQAALELEDIVQESFLRAFQSIHDFSWRGEESFLRWLGGISNHVLQEEAKRQKLRSASPLEYDVSHDQPSQSTVQRREERFDRLEKALENLSPDHRRVVLLARVERLPLKEVALRMNRTRDAARQLLWRALQELKANFGETESLHLPPRSLETEGGNDELE